MLDMVDSLSVSTQAALSGLETRLLALQSRVDSCLPGLLPPPIPPPPPPPVLSLPVDQEDLSLEAALSTY